VDLKMTEEQKMICATIRRFVRDEIIPLEESELDADAYELPEEHEERLRAIAESTGIPGANGLDMKTKVFIAEETSQHRAGLYHPCYGLFRLGDEGAVEGAEGGGFIGLTEPSGGSDPARAIRTRGVRDGDEWVINGSKVFNSGADTAAWGTVYVRTGDTPGRDSISAFRVPTDTPGFEVRRLIHVLRSHYTTELSFTDMRVPASAMIGREGEGFANANARLSGNRITYAAHGIGLAVAAHRMATEYARNRVTFGEPLSNRQAIQWMLVDNEIDIRTSRWLCLTAAEKFDSEESFRFEAAMAKVYATEAAGRVVDRSMQIHGGYGMTKDMPFERWFRELRIRRVGEGPSEIQRLIMARDLAYGSVQAGKFELEL
jgi:acyl-CoA dehydrogenase